MKEKIRHGLTLLAFIAVTEGVGLLAALLSGDSAARYAELQRPPLSPPGAVFGIAWTILYALMAIAAYLVFKSDAPRQQVREALTWYAAQLFVNALWPIVYFRFGALWAAVVVLVVLIAFVVGTMRRFYHINPAAGWLLVPYLLWLLFATYLNIGTALLN